jgi:[NiFe] hydrogenase assembly HybE family chaperone
MIEPPTPEQIATFSNALEAHFREAHRRAMQDAPICNPALEVACVGFRAWGDRILGVLVTPWFMNLVLTPAGSRETESVAFPSGAISFRRSDLQGLEPLMMCSLFSPMQDFADQEAALATARAALEGVFDAGLLDAVPAREVFPALPVARRESPAERAEHFRLREEVQDAACETPVSLDRRAFLLRARVAEKAAP